MFFEKKRVKGLAKENVYVCVACVFRALCRGVQSIKLKIFHKIPCF